ncbi:type VI secretion system baseplate subunit TssG [Ectothiorhodospiraceae bacterium WFHF3C12]|nr:type VI secretion system baseplate subunit TssG [Ectothiorhodospiraceae bacterium WFHF3C12]
MAGESGSTDHVVAPALQALAEEPHRYGLFAALRLVEASHPRAPRLGRSRRPSEDPVRVSQRPSMRFAPGDVTAFVPGSPHRLECESFGVFGPNGALPLHLTEYADERSRIHRDPTFAAFINTFQHRLASLFYRAWAEAQPAVQHDRPDSDHFSTYVGATIGAGTPGLVGRDELGDFARLCRAGRFAPAAKSLEGLEDILVDYFDVPCRIEPFQPRWLSIPAEERLALGRRRGNGLGQQANIGRRSWQCQFSFRIFLGPLPRKAFERFLPGGPALGDLVDLVRSYIGEELSWDVSLAMRGEDAPPLRLARGPRLGWTSWLGRVRGEHAVGTRIHGSRSTAHPREAAGNRPPLRRDNSGRD